MMMERIKSMDKNGDGKIERSEVSDRMERMFNRLDANGDGVADEKEIKALLGIPDNVDTAALLPLGYPADGKGYGPTRRRPVEEVTYNEKWGQAWVAEG